MLFITAFLDAQKKPLDSNSYDGWKTLGSPVVSDNGKWISYTINPQQGDGWIYFYNTQTGQKDSVSRGTNLMFSPDNKYLVYQVLPSYSETRQAKKKKLKEDKMPKNDLVVRLLPDNTLTRISRVKSFSLSEKNSYWMAYLLEKRAAEKNGGKVAGDSIRTSEVSVPKKKQDPGS